MSYVSHNLVQITFKNRRIEKHLFLPLKFVSWPLSSSFTRKERGNVLIAKHIGESLGAKTRGVGAPALISLIKEFKRNCMQALESSR